jgi:hypothetical protein
MFIGHYSLGLALKKQSNEIPLWVMFLAVQLVDILAFCFVLLGWERISYAPNENPFLRTVIEYVPYTHSLLGNLILGLLVFVIFWKVRSRAWGVLLGIGVFSHWVLDALVHTPDMPLYFDQHKVGLGLWSYPYLSFSIEVLSLVAASYYIYGKTEITIRHIVLIGFLLAGFSGMMFAPEAEATPSQMSLGALSIYAIATGLAYWVDRAKIT